MKKLSILFVCVACALILSVCASASALGDVDTDGRITSADARLALRVAVGLEPEVLPGTDAFEAADADFSGSVTAEDARSILRCAVALEDLAERLPESEALSKQALEDRLNACMLDFFVYYDEGHGSSGTGFAINDDGTVVVPYLLIHKATKITVERAGCNVESVLWADSASGLALLKVSGDIPFLPVNRTWFDVGDSAYSTDYMGMLHRLTITAPPSGDGQTFLPHAIFAKIPVEEYMFDLKFYPLADRFGRAIGFILDDCPVNGRRTAVAAPLSLLPAPDAFSPRTVDAFSRDEWRVTLDCPEREIELVQYGTGAIPLYAENRTIEVVEVLSAKTDFIDVSVSSIEPEIPILVILAKRPCRDIPVTVRVKGMYADAEITLHVTVTEEGYVNMVGAAFLPDPGVVWETLPTGCSVSKSIEFSFLKLNTGLSDEELFYSYTDMLADMGYEYLRTEELDRMNRYWFRLEEYGATVVYTDMSSSVSILCYYDE